MMNKWYFQADFSAYNFIMLKAAAIGLNTPYLKYQNDNNCVGITCLNPDIFDSPGFWQGTTYSTKLKIYSYKKNTTTTTSQTYTLTQLTKCTYASDSVFWWQYLQPDALVVASNNIPDNLSSVPESTVKTT